MTGGRHLLLTADAVGGVWQYSIELAAALHKFDYHVTLAVLGPGLTAAQKDHAAAIPDLRVMETGLELEWLASGPEPIERAEAQLQAMAGDLRADIVQLHSPALTSIGGYPCPVVAALHSCVATWWAAVRGGPMPEDFNWRSAMVAQGMKRAARVVTPSAAFARAARAHYGVAPMAVHNGRSFPVVQAPMQDFVLTAGRLWDEGKNVRTLDLAAARMDVPFEAAGPLRSPQGDRIEMTAIRSLGSLDEGALAAKLGARPVFVSAALYEPFGLAVLEAASAGCALIVSDIATFRELWDGAAVFVDPRDVDGFRGAIEAMLSDRAAREHAGQRAQQRARRYTSAAMAGRMAELYDQVQHRVAA